MKLVILLIATLLSIHAYAQEDVEFQVKKRDLNKNPYRAFILPKFAPGATKNNFPSYYFSPDSNNIVFMDSSYLLGDTIQLPYKNTTITKYHFWWCDNSKRWLDMEVKGNVINLNFYRILASCRSNNLPLYIGWFRCVNEKNQNVTFNVCYRLKFKEQEP